VLRVEQNKTGRILEIALTGELLALVETAVGNVPVLHRPIAHKQRRRGKDEAYIYSGLDSMLRRAQKKGAAEDAVAAGVRIPRPKGQRHHRHVTGRRANRAHPGIVRAQRQGHHRDLRQAALARICSLERSENRRLKPLDMRQRHINRLIRAKRKDLESLLSP